MQSTLNLMLHFVETYRNASFESIINTALMYDMEH